MCTIKLKGLSKDLVLHSHKVGELVTDRFCNLRNILIKAQQFIQSTVIVGH